MPAEMFGEVTRGFDRAGPDNEPQSRLVKCLEVGHRQHAGVGDHHHFAELVSGRELVDDRDDGVGFGFVAFPGADLQREPMAVHEKPDDDLRIDAAFLAVSDLAELVFVLDLEMQGRHVIHH